MNVLFSLQVAASVPQLRRHKRDWVIPTKNLKENFDYTTAGYVAKIRSDEGDGGILYYSLLGPGASEVPLNLFVVQETTGLVFIRGSLDREERETYILSGVARSNDGRVVESGINLRFDVDDENDNTPVFVPVPPATVNESSPAGTLVGVITATDADQANSSHSKITYSIKKQEPSDGTDLFYIDRNTGSIYVKENTLDREIQSSYILTVTGSDMDGALGANTGTGTIHVHVVDINDNRPMLDKDEYEGAIVENTAKVEVMRFTVLDADEEKTDNWLAVFDIVTGNEDGIFSIKTDPKTNEGVLMLEKPVDFEENPDIKLGLLVSNVAPAVGQGGAGASMGGGGGAGAGAGAGMGAGAGAGAGAGSAGAGGKKPVKKKRPKKGKIYQVNIAVLNEPEGVNFKPSVKPVFVSENPDDNPLMEVIAVFRATETDTGKPAENVRYAKGYDPDNWLLIDPETAEIRLQKYPDRESPFLINGTYYAKILSLTEETPPKMITGTIALQVGDVNDNCPSLTNDVEYICSDTEVINVTAVDEDGDPNSAPFSFSLVSEETQGEWRVEPSNDTGVSLKALRPLWPGHYKVAFIIQDQQGLACPDPQYLDLHVCSCEEGETCRAPRLHGQRRKSSLEHLIVYHTEGRGEDKSVPLLSSPVQMTRATTSAVQAINIASMTKVDTTTSFKSLNMDTANNRWQHKSQCVAEGRMQQSSFRKSRGICKEAYSKQEQLLLYKDMDGIALSDVFLHEFYSQKASCAAARQATRDNLLEYDYEGQGSPAGSVGCCSILESDNDLQFLDDLGLKFKTLVDDHIARLSLDTKPPGIHGMSPEPNQNVSISQSSTRVINGFNGAACSSMHVQSADSTSNKALSSHVSPVTTAMQPSPGQMLVLQQQQPVYYTTTPVLQPMHYVVQPQLQSNVLLAEAPVTNLQGMILLNGTPQHTKHILHGGNTARTLTLGRQRGQRVVKETQGAGIWVRSDGAGEVMGVRRSGRRIKSEGGDMAEHRSIGTLVGGHMSVEAAGSEEGQLVKARGNKTRRRSTTSAETGFI
uniref:Desmoglein 2 n=1 Tax=Dicentrarchus labrax TaxID=13489 RepID=A0A8P4KDP5_DICLA